MAGVSRSFVTLPLSVRVAILPPREQAYENLSFITLISFGIGHCWRPEIINSYHLRIGCVGTAVIYRLNPNFQITTIAAIDILIFSYR
jgi:hypothetical protein